MKHFQPLCVLLIAAISASVTQPVEAQCQQFDAGFATRGTNGTVAACAIFDDGQGPALYVGGQFTAAGQVNAMGVARWDGQHWQSLGSGIGAGGVNSLCVFNDGSGTALYAGGVFQSAGGVPVRNIAKWNGLTWSPVGWGVDGSVRSMAVYDSGAGPALYASGGFHFSDTLTLDGIGKWDGSAWSSVGGGLNGSANALPFIRAPVRAHAAGVFHGAGVVPANNVASWDGTNWAALAMGTNPSLFALAVRNELPGDLSVTPEEERGRYRTLERDRRERRRRWLTPCATYTAVDVGSGPGFTLAERSLKLGALASRCRMGRGTTCQLWLAQRLCGGTHRFQCLVKAPRSSRVGLRRPEARGTASRAGRSCPRQTDEGRCEWLRERLPDWTLA